MTKLAVYCITKNEEMFVDRMMESVKQADYIIVVDTGSTDNTPYLMGYFTKKDKRIKYHRRKENYGIGFTRNEGLRLVSKESEYIAVCDSDDLMSPHRLEKQLKYIKKYNVDFVYSNL